MLNPVLQLNEAVFDERAEGTPTRDGFGEGLVAAGEANQNVVALTADLSESTRTNLFAERFPERFFEVGVAEQNMATIAAGLGISGKIPFITSYAVFSPGRNYEQIRTTICYNDANVKIVGAHAGVSVGPDGATHQATEDIAIMRVLPNIKVFVPCDAIEARKATIAAATIWGPVYLRLGRAATPDVTTNATPFVPGKIETFWEPKQGKKASVAIVACGGMVATALRAARALERDDVHVAVLCCHTVKPLDTRTLALWAKRCGAFVVAEEHQQAGGLGGAVAEYVAREYPVPIEFVGLADTFGESGSPAALVKKYGLDITAVIGAVSRVLKRVR